jgi:hypothetical protein
MNLYIHNINLDTHNILMTLSSGLYADTTERQQICHFNSKACETASVVLPNIGSCKVFVFYEEWQ